MNEHDIVMILIAIIQAMFTGSLVLLTIMMGLNIATTAMWLVLLISIYISITYLGDRLLEKKDSE